MPVALLAEVTAVVAGTSTQQIFRMSNRDDPSVGTLNGVQWEPVGLKVEGLSHSTFDPDFGGGGVGASGSITFSMNLFNTLAASWSSAPVKIYVGEVGDAWSSYTLVFSGIVGQVTAKSDGRGSATLRLSDRWLDSPVLNLSYAGTTGAEGPANLKGTPKPFCWGSPVGIEPIAIDPAALIYQFHGYGSVQAVTNVQDGGNNLTATSNYSTYANLAAATVPPGKYATCLAQGMVRLGAPAEKPLTLNVSGDNGTSAGFIQRAGAVITRLAGLAGATPGQLDSTSLSALDAAVTGTISHYLTTQTNARQIIAELAGRANATAIAGLDGKLSVPRPNISATPVIAYYTTGEGPFYGSSIAETGTCGKVVFQQLPVPYWRLQATCAQTYRTLSPDEITGYAKPVYKGDYSGSTTYREGDVVTGSNDAKYFYTSATPTAGNAPPNGTYWALYEAAPAITNVTGAGALALLNSADFATQVGGATKPANNATVGADWNSNVSNKPTSLSAINSTEASKLAGIQSGATAGAIWGSNISGQPADANILNSSFSLGTNGELRYYGASGWTTVGTANLSVTGAGAMAFFASLTTGNIGTYIQTGAIGSALIGSAAIGTVHIADANVTSAKIDDLSSTTFSSGSAGWKIWKNGNAEFNGVVISRDQILYSGDHNPGYIAGGGYGSGWTLLQTGAINAGAAAAWMDNNGPVSLCLGFTAGGASTGVSRWIPAAWRVDGKLSHVQGDYGSYFQIDYEIWGANVDSISPANIGWVLYKVT